MFKTGDTLICDQYREIIKIERRYFLCNEDTIFSDEIHSRITNEGTFFHVDDIFLKKIINGKLSIFSGIKDEIVYEDVSNAFDDPVFQYVRKSTPVLYYSFDNVEFAKYNTLFPNPLLVDSIKENYEAYKFYRKYKTTQIAGMISTSAFAIPLIIGLTKSNKIKDVIPYAVISGSGIMACICITVSLPEKLFSKAVACYNME